MTVARRKLIWIHISCNLFCWAFLCIKRNKWGMKWIAEGLFAPTGWYNRLKYTHRAMQRLNCSFKVWKEFRLRHTAYCMHQSWCGSTPRQRAGLPASSPQQTSISRVVSLQSEDILRPSGSYFYISSGGFIFLPSPTVLVPMRHKLTGNIPSIFLSVYCRT